MKILYRLRFQSSNNQSGQVSIIISMVLIIVMSVLTLAVSETSIRETKNDTNTQLSNQANFAAEAGVNDAIKAIQANGSPGITSSCSQNTGGNGLNLNGSLDPSKNIGYTCLTVNLTPSTLVNDVTRTDSVVDNISTPSPLSSLTFKWNFTPTTSNPLVDCSITQLQFVPLAAWDCPSPLLRVDIYNGSLNTSPKTSEDLQADTDSFYIFPVDSTNSPGPTVSYTTGFPAEPQVLYASCSAATNQCSQTINFSTTPTNYELQTGAVRMTSIYSDAGNVTVSSGGSNVVFQDSQAEIDSTGVDQNEAQRIDVRVPLTTTNTSTTAPNYAAVANYELCKRYALSGTLATTYPSPWEGVAADIANFMGTWGEGSGGNNGPLCGGALKPAIYLYPTHSELVNVKVSYPTGLKTTIPSYNPTSGWNVEAQPNGNLTNTADGKSYPYLYWEGNTDSFNFNMSQGFVVPGKDTAAFLSRELAIIGLNKNEISGFLQYWVPKMQNNPYSLIHFAGSDYTKMAPLNITPKPNAVLRVFMAEESIPQPVKVTPQHFNTFKRSGFTVVEWGGSVLN